MYNMYSEFVKSIIVRAYYFHFYFELIKYIDEIKVCVISGFVVDITKEILNRLAILRIKGSFVYCNVRICLTRKPKKLLSFSI